MIHTLNKKKYENVMLYLCHKLGGEVRGKKKMAKLLYFVDFDYYEKTQQSMTGDIYKALPMGPFPVQMDVISSLMSKNKTLIVEKVLEVDGYNPTEIYKSQEKPDMSAFSKDEVKILDRVILKYGHLTGKQLEDLSHNEAPYVGTKLNDEIYYELAYYRGTNFNE